MRFFGETNIDFIGKRKIAFIISALIILAGIVSLVINKGPAYSIDFTGGISLELDITPLDGGEVLDVQEIRNALATEGFDDVQIQSVKGAGERELILIKASSDGNEGDQIIEAMRKNFPQNTNHQDFIRLQEKVGPKVGDELRGKAILAAFWALFGIILYIWWRFEFSFGLAAVIALFHDVLITVGIFSILGREISLPVVAALLTIIGYSLNDTIVIFDRIREDLKLYRKKPFSEVINMSINQTLSRTIITSLTTFVVVLSLYIFGGSVIHDLALALLIGVCVGTYSSVFIASPILVEHFQNRQKRMLKK
jgi:preprotein translocase SecF subunit